MYSTTRLKRKPIESSIELFLIFSSGIFRSLFPVKGLKALLKGGWKYCLVKSGLMVNSMLASIKSLIGNSKPPPKITPPVKSLTPTSDGNPLCTLSGNSLN